jgi:ribosomal protein S27AE
LRFEDPFHVYYDGVRYALRHIHAIPERVNHLAMNIRSRLRYNDRVCVKNTRTCPKCASTELMQIPGSKWAEGEHIQLRGMWPVVITRYLCGRCGFSEEWLDDPKPLKP